MIDLELLIPDELPDSMASRLDQLLTITREALSNIARHSGATRAVAGVVSPRRHADPAHRRQWQRLRCRRGRELRAITDLTNLQSRAEALGGSIRGEERAGRRDPVEAHLPLSGEDNEP